MSPIVRTLYRNLSTRQLYFLGAVVPLFCTLVIGFLQWYSVSDLMKSRELVRHSRNFQLAMGTFRYSLSDAESCQFRYILTHNDANIGLYRQLIGTAKDQMAVLQMLAADNTLQAKRVAAIEPMVDDKIRKTDESISREQSGDHAGALEIISSEDSRNNMLAIEDTVQKMFVTESGILFDRQQNYQHRFMFIASLSVLSMTLCLGFIFGILLLLRRLTQLQSTVTLSALSQMIEYEGGLITIEEYLKRRREALDTHGAAQVEAERILGLLGKKVRKISTDPAT